MIGKIYYWFWHDFLQRKEPFTLQFRRMADARPLVFWGTVGTICSGLIVGIGFMAWFIIHIIGVC